MNQSTAPGKLGQIRKTVLIQASHVVVFKALTEAKELVRWFCDRAVSEPREGGELVVGWSTGSSSQEGRAVFTHVVPGSIVELLWVDEGQRKNTENERHILSYVLRSRPSGTELVMSDSDNLPPDDDEISILDEGWNNVLLELKDYCERRERSARSHPAKDAS